jgi:hypothetical protein
MKPPKIYCQCGCGEEIKLSSDHKGKIPKFLKNHQLKKHHYVGKNENRHRRTIFEKNGVTLEEVILNEYMSFSEIAEVFDMAKETVSYHFYSREGLSLINLAVRKSKQFINDVLVLTVNNSNKIETEWIDTWHKEENGNSTFLAKGIGRMYSNIPINPYWNKVAFKVSKTKYSKIYNIDDIIVKSVIVNLPINSINDEKYIKESIQSSKYCSKDTRVYFKYYKNI